MNNEIFIKNILNSTNGITKVFPDDSLYVRIQEQIAYEKKVSNYAKFFVAASISLLVFINVEVLYHNEQISNSINDVSKLVVTADNQLY
ncbi:hypothetical protein [uncultured Flavobacterium sp.]|uniref:hypothetical protein n=1 Tax=uncultured Flavobacterium sp. TaxID=165435 RepID=UPI0030CA3B90